MSTPTLRLPIVTAGQPTGQTVEIARALPVAALPEHLRWLGFRLTTTGRGRLALERLH